MDPNANLARQLEIAREIQGINDRADDSGEITPGARQKLEQLADELAELVVALHEWITNGGFLPTVWGTQNHYAQGAALLRLIEQRGTPKIVRQNDPTAWMMPGYVLVTFEDGFECGIAPDGAVSS